MVVGDLFSSQATAGCSVPTWAKRYTTYKNNIYDYLVEFTKLPR